MKGHEDGGMFFGADEALPETSSGAFGQILRKEVIQPQVPLRLPCYDFTPASLEKYAGERRAQPGSYNHLRAHETEPEKLSLLQLS